VLRPSLRPHSAAAAAIAVATVHLTAGPREFACSLAGSWRLCCVSCAQSSLTWPSLRQTVQPPLSTEFSCL